MSRETFTNRETCALATGITLHEHVILNVLFGNNNLNGVTQCSEIWLNGLFIRIIIIMKIK